MTKCTYFFTIWFTETSRMIFGARNTGSNSLYICLQELRIISLSVVNMTEKLWCCQLDLGHFLSWLERFIQRNHKKKKNISVFFLSLYFYWEKMIFIKINCWKSYYRILRTDIWDYGNFRSVTDCDFSVMFTTENEIIRSSWRQISRL